MNIDYISAAVSEVAAPIEHTVIAPVWRRCIAYFIDSLLLGLLISNLGRFEFERLSQLGLWGICLGFPLGALYFASMDSKIGNGQTIGKRLMKVRVVNGNGQSVSLARAFTRYTVFVIPVLLYGWRLPLTKTPWIALDIVFFWVYWVGGSSIYLMIFERLNRQGLHDITVRTFVVYADHEGPIEKRDVPQLHWGILISLLFAISLGAAALKSWSDRQPTQVEFHRDSTLIESIDGVERAYLRDRLIHDPSGTASKVLFINIVRRTNPPSEQDFARNVVRSLSNSDRLARSYDFITVRLYYGYDLGLGSLWHHRDFEQKPREWIAAVAPDHVTK